MRSTKAAKAGSPHVAGRPGARCSQPCGSPHARPCPSAAREGASCPVQAARCAPSLDGEDDTGARSRDQPSPHDDSWRSSWKARSADVEAPPRTTRWSSCPRSPCATRTSEAEDRPIGAFLLPGPAQHAAPSFTGLGTGSAGLRRSPAVPPLPVYTLRRNGCVLAPRTSHVPRRPPWCRARTGSGGSGPHIP